MGLSIIDIASATGLTHYPQPGTFNNKAGMLIGFKSGFLFNVGIRNQDGRICVLVRYKAARDPQSMLSAFKADPSMKAMYTIADMHYQGDQSLLWTFGKPLRFKAEEFTKALDAMAAILSVHAQPFELGRCEGEGCRNSVDHLTLANGIPNLICAACKERVAGEVQLRQQEYERREPNVMKALLYGLGAAAGSGLAAGALMYWDLDDKGFHPKFFIALTLLISLAVAYAVKHGVRRVTYGACGLAGVLALLGKVIADVVFFANTIAAGDGVPADAGLVVGVLANLWSIKWEFNGFVAVFDVLVILITPWICWRMRPRFVLAFEELPHPRPITAMAARV